MDFQENSGLSRMLEQSVEHNLDELLVMAESGRYSTNRINSCIGRKHKLDYVYPIENTECLCEINTVICNNLLQMLGKEMHYDCIVLNMGTRFKGFLIFLADAVISTWYRKRRNQPVERVRVYRGAD